MLGLKVHVRVGFQFGFGGGRVSGIDGQKTWIFCVGCVSGDDVELDGT